MDGTHLGLYSILVVIHGHERCRTSLAPSTSCTAPAVSSARGFASSRYTYLEFFLTGLRAGRMVKVGPTNGNMSVN